VIANARGFALGTLVIAAFAVIAMLAISFGASNGALIIWVSLPVGGFIAARTAVSHKLLLSSALVLPGMAMFWLLHIYRIAGSVASGGSTTVEAAPVLLVALLCLGGGLIGRSVSKGMPPNTSLERTRDK
jgi:hypothetical protein